MPERAEIFRVVLNCVTGEKIVFRRVMQGKALVEIELERKTVKAEPLALLLALKAINLNPE